MTQSSQRVALVTSETTDTTGNRPAKPASPRVIDSADLFDDQDEVVVTHKGTPYRLRITRQDKLILTK